MLKLNQVRIYIYIYIYDETMALYFARRLPSTHPRSKNLKGIFEKQKYSCPVCGLLFKSDNIYELHHVLDANKNRTGKLQWAHAHCHDQIYN